MKHLQIWCIVPVFGLLIVGCTSNAMEGDEKQRPVHFDELNAELTDSRLLRRLGVEEVFLIEVEPYRVTIAEAGSTEPLGELYYTIQDGWHLKADNETFEFVPGEGWIIAEQ